MLFNFMPTVSTAPRFANWRLNQEYIDLNTGVLKDGVKSSNVKLADIIPPYTNNFAINIKNNLGQVTKGTYGMVWNGNAFVYSDGSAKGQAVKVMPGDQFIGYDSRTNIASGVRPDTVSVKSMSADQFRRYVVRWGATEVDFSAYGVKPVALSESDKKWLEKAEEYFVGLRSVKTGKVVGSSRRYTNQETLRALWAVAVNAGICPKRFVAQIFKETRFDPTQVGNDGERGLGQFMQMTARERGLDWKKLSAGEKEAAYQLVESAKFKSLVGEVRYNGSVAYRNDITNIVNAISRKVKG